MKTDVLIIGAGPTGLLLANLLGSMGVPTLVIERNTKTVSMPRAVSIDDESMRTIQSIGLDRDLDAIIQKGYGSICKGPAGDVFAEVKPVSREFGFEKRNENYPQLTDHYFTGDYPVKPVDELGDSKITQLSLLSTASNN